MAKVEAKAVTAVEFVLTLTEEEAKGLSALLFCGVSFGTIGTLGLGSVCSAVCTTVGEYDVDREGVQSVCHIADVEVKPYGS